MEDPERFWLLHEFAFNIVSDETALLLGNVGSLTGDLNVSWCVVYEYGIDKTDDGIAVVIEPPAVIPFGCGVT